MKNSADQGKCYPPRLKAKVNNTLQDLQNSSYPTKAEFNNFFIIHLKYFPVLKRVFPFCSLFFFSPKITQPCPQVFSVNGAITSSWLHFWHHWFMIWQNFWCPWFNMRKFFLNSVNSSCLWYIMCAVLTNWTCVNFLHPFHP